MTLQTIIILSSIGILAGLLSGFVGVGGGIIIVPALVFLVGLTQHEAQGTSLFVLAMPVVWLGLMNYWKEGNVQWKYGLIIAAMFFIGAYFGSKLSLKLSPSLVKFLFGILMALVSVKLILSGYQSIVSNED
ncbi:MAG: sulfite exporter TauE/SafE family protein [Crocinitomicaceae bacterium]|tara:strand:+ start:103 stop:498 length:396 start_codon:yes stop_codon:yes gene_type:complete